MKKYIKFLEKNHLFMQIPEEEILELLKEIDGVIKKVKKDDVLLRLDDPVKTVGIVLEGQLNIVKQTKQGERIVVTSIHPNQYFQEALCCGQVAKSPVSVVASKESTVLFMDYKKMISVKNARLIENLLFILAQKNFILQNRLDLLGIRTLRQKIISYLKSVSDKQGSNKIYIPFDREEFADFLCVDRSALSHELSKMKKDGMINYHKNEFELYI